MDRLENMIRALIKLQNKILLEVICSAVSVTLQISSCEASFVTSLTFSDVSK